MACPFALRGPLLRTIPSHVAVAVAAIIGFTDIARAGVPIFAGPGGPDVPSGLREPDPALTRGVTNKGVVIAQATTYLNSFNTGTHGFRWDTTGSPLFRYGGVASTNLPTRVSAINNTGVAVGTVTAANGDIRPVIYGPVSATPIALAIPAFISGNHSTANAYLLNDSHVIAGMATLYDGPTLIGERAVRWDGSNTDFTPLGILNADVNGFAKSVANAISPNGTIVGSAAKYNAAGTINLGMRGMRWAGGTTIGFELDTPFVRSDGFASVDVRNVNASGSALGTTEKWAGSNSQGDRAVRWNAGGTAATVLGTLGGDVNGVTVVNAYGLNNAGTAVGTVEKYSAANVSLGYRAVRWDATGTAATELGLTPGVNMNAFTGSEAYAINNVGTSAGRGVDPTNTAIHAMVWPGKTGGIIPLDLNTLLRPQDSGWTLYSAYSVSDTGFVVGQAVYDPDGAGGSPNYLRAFSMLVPQAGTYGMGDANFDTAVDFADLVLLAQNYNLANPTISLNVADFDLDGDTDFNDLVALAQNYNTSPAAIAMLGNGTFSADWARAMSLIPEPATMAALAGVIATVLRRRRPVRSAFMSRPIIMATAAAAAAGSMTSAALAANKVFSGPNNGQWTLAGNWTGGVVPGPGDDVTVGTVNGGATDLNVAMNASFNALPLNSLTLNSSGISGTLNFQQIAAGTHMKAKVVNVGTTVAPNNYIHSAGTNEAYALNIGVNSQNNVYLITGSAELLSGQENVGISGSGHISQDSGTNTLSEGYLGEATVVLGVNASGSGTYSMTGGFLNAIGIVAGKLGAGTFSQFGGVVTVDRIDVSGFGGSGAYTQSGGLVTAGEVHVGSSGTFTLASGTLDAPVYVAPGGTFSFTGGAFEPTNEIGGTGGSVLLNGHSQAVAGLNGTGTVIQSSSNAVLTVSVNNAALVQTFGGTIQNGGAGIVSLTKAGTFTQVLSGVNVYTGLTIVSDGTLRAGSNSGFSSASQFVVNGGTVDVGGFDVTVGALSGTGGSVQIGLKSITAGGNNLTTAYAGILIGSGTLNKAGSGQFTLAGGGNQFTGQINVNAGSLTAGAVNGIPAGAAVSLAGLGTALNINFAQSLRSISGGSLTTLNFAGNSALQVGGTNQTLTYQGGFSGTGALTKVGLGTFTIGFGAGDTIASNTASAVSFNVLGGTLLLNKADGTNVVGGPLLIGGASAVTTLQRNNQIADTSVLTLTSGKFNLFGFNETIGGLIGSGGTIALTGGALSVNQTSNVSISSALTGPGTFTKAGLADLTLTNASTYNGGFAASAGKLILPGSLGATSIVANNGGKVVLPGTIVNLNGGVIDAKAGSTLEYSNASITSASLKGAGTHLITPAATSSFYAVATESDAIISQNGPALFSNLANSGTINSNADLQLNGGFNASGGAINVNKTTTTLNFVSAGSITVNAVGALANATGALTLGTGSQTTITPGGTLQLLNGTSAQLNNALLVNNGVIMGAASVNNGSIAKGDGSYGTLNVNSGGVFIPGLNGPVFSLSDDLNLAPGSSVLMELGGSAQGTQHDSLVVANAAAVAGTLSLSLLNGYVPTQGVVHHVIVGANPRTGTFNQVTGVAVTNTTWLAVTYPTNGVDVTAALPGDANLSGGVNFADLVILAQNYNQLVGGTWVSGDFTGDGATTFPDLVALAQHYNQGVVDAAALAAMDSGAFSADWALAQALLPEPTAVALIIVAAVGGTLSRRRPQ